MNEKQSKLLIILFIISFVQIYLSFINLSALCLLSIYLDHNVFFLYSSNNNVVVIKL